MNRDAADIVAIQFAFAGVPPLSRADFVVSHPSKSACASLHTRSVTTEADSARPSAAD